MKKLLSIFLSVSMLVAVCLISTMTAFAVESDSKTSAVPVALSDELQTLENEANEKYNKLLETWAYNPQFIDDVNANFPTFYGGAYINGEKKLVIQVTSCDESVVGYFENIIDLTNVIFEEVKYSYDELKQAHAEIAEKMDATSTDSLISNIAGVGISFPDNAVSLYLVTSESVAKSDSIRKEIQNKVSTFDNIKIITTPTKDTPSAAVEPGTEIKNSGYSRSVGFWAEDGDGNLGIVTAPHSSISEGTTMSIGTRTFGTAATPYYSGNVDAVFVERTNTYFSATRFVSGWDFNLTSSGYTILAVGSTTYSKGISSGCQSGEITDNNYTTSYGISNCVVTSATCDSGDSGGIVAGSGTSSSRYVAGIITGKQGGTSYVIYVKAGNILSTLGVSVY